jgi:hypothetical protein
MDFPDWTPSEVVQQLQSLGLGKYGQNFMQNHINGEAFVLLRDEHMKELGIKAIGHRLTITNFINDWRSGPSKPVAIRAVKPAPVAVRSKPAAPPPDENDEEEDEIVSPAVNQRQPLPAAKGVRGKPEAPPKGRTAAPADDLDLDANPFQSRPKLGNEAGSKPPAVRPDSATSYAAPKQQASPARPPQRSTLAPPPPSSESDDEEEELAPPPRNQHHAFASAKPAAVRKPDPPAKGRKPPADDFDLDANPFQSRPKVRDEDGSKQQIPPARVAPRGRAAPPPPPPADESESEDESAPPSESEDGSDDGGENYDVGAANLVACKICEHRFAPDRIAKHEQICAKAHARKSRRKFDARKQRLAGTDAAAFAKAGADTSKKVKKVNYVAEHERLVSILRNARLAEGGKAPPIVEPEDDRVTCPHCGRKFAESAAERHIPGCARMHSKAMDAGPRHGRR